MNNPEIIKSSEQPTRNKAESRPWDSALTLPLAESIVAARRERLEKLKPLMVLSFYYHIAEKLQREEGDFRWLLTESDARKEALAKYSFVLNPSYFHQKLW